MTPHTPQLLQRPYWLLIGMALLAVTAPHYALGQSVATSVSTSTSVVAPATAGGLMGVGAPAPALPGTATAPAAPALPGLTPMQGPRQQDPSQAESAPRPVVVPLAERAELVSNQFQRFVQSATGRDLPLHGYRLFDNQRFSPQTNIPVPANYVIGPGDEIDLKIWGSIDSALRLTVDRNGQISIPKVGTFSVVGTRADQLEATLLSQLSRVFKNFQISATLGKLRSIQIYVVGQARQPGAYNISGLSTLINALFESGGPSASGSLRNIELVRAGRTVAQLDLYRFIHSGQTLGDVQLMPGDVIVIPPAGPRVALLGALDTPAIYELRQPQESLQALLSYSGGLNIVTTPHKALIERIDPANGQAPRSVQERRLDSAGLQTMVRDGDIVTLFPISPSFSNAVTLRGNVAAPLRYSHKPGMRVSDLIPEPQALIQADYYTRKNSVVQFESGKDVAGERVINDVVNLLEEINWDYAAIERLDPEQIKTVLIPFNLGRAIKQKDPAHNITLLPGDVVTVFGVRDLPVPLEKRSQFVRIAGEVKVPGIYQISLGETLPQLIQRSGGFSANAFPYGTQFTRESTRRTQQANLDQAIRRLEQDINGQVATRLQNVTNTDQGGAVQAQVASQRLLLGRLQGLRASGRIALEMSADQTELPNLTLEDGDSIVVPHRPSFVGVFGAVQAETSFLYRPGQSAAHYIDKAGPTREADLQAALIIRADGTVQSNQASRSLLGWGHSSFMRSTIHPGDSVFVPEVLDRRSAYTQFIQGAKDWTQLLFQFGLGAAALRTISQ